MNIDIINDVFIENQQVLRRYRDFLSWLGLPPHLQQEYKAHHTCRLISEFALEFRTARERVIQTIEKKKAMREKRKREKAVSCQCQMFLRSTI